MKTVVGKLNIEIRPCGEHPLDPAANSNKWSVDISSRENDFHILFKTNEAPSLELRHLDENRNVLDVQYLSLDRFSKAKIH